jgi:6-phosphogluconolactonase
VNPTALSVLFTSSIAVVLLAVSGGCNAHPSAGPTTAPVATTPPAPPQIEHVYIGTYTKTTSKGIYLFDLDPSTGALTARGLAVEAEDPHFLAIDPTHRFLYAGASTAADPKDPSKITGMVDAFSIDRDSGKLTLLNQQPAGGKGATYVAVPDSGNTVLVANYGSATIASLPIDPATGKLQPPMSVITQTGSSVNPDRQQHSYPHSINPEPLNGQYVFVPDLGADKIFIYRLNSLRSDLTPSDPPFVTVPPGSGPRHMAFHPNHRFAYVINEMGGTVITYALDASKGTLAQLQVKSTLPSDFTGTNTAAEVRVHPSGKFLYASNRGHDSIAVFALDPDTGLLSPRGYQSTQGKTPRNFSIDPSGRWLIAANQGSDTIVVFRIDEATGALTPTGTTASVPLPVCVLIMPPPPGVM